MIRRSKRESPAEGRAPAACTPATRWGQAFLLGARLRRTPFEFAADSGFASERSGAIRRWLSRASARTSSQP